MVVSIKELVNKHFFITGISSQVLNIVKLPFRMDIDVNNNNREKSTSSSRMISRSVFIISNVLSCTYYIRIECNNDLSNNMAVNPIDSSQLSYKDNFESKDNLVSKTTIPIPIKEL